MCVRCKKLKLCDCVYCGMQPTYDACGVAPSVAMLKNKSSKQYIQNSCGEAQPPLDENYEKGNAGGSGDAEKPSWAGWLVLGWARLGSPESYRELKKDLRFEILASRSRQSRIES